MEKKILIDINSVIPLYSRGFLYGVGRSIYELVSAINSHKKDYSFNICLYSQNLRNITARRDFNNLKYFHFWFPNRIKFKKLLSLFKFQRFFTRYSLIHIPHNTDISENLKKTIFTIHDLVVYRYPEFWGLTERERNEHKKIAQKCKHIITCSQSSKNDIIKYWNVPDEKITVIHWGINRDIFKPTFDETILKKYNITSDYFFCASCNHKRKNLPTILQAFSQYIEKGGKNQLILLSPIPEELENYTDLIDSNKIIICKGISDYELSVLYSMANSSIMYSLYEGFCFPLLESLACGTNCICTENSCEREIINELGDYTNGDVDSLCDKLLEREKHRVDMNTQEVNEYLKNFSWEECAKRHLVLYSKLLNS